MIISYTIHPTPSTIDYLVLMIMDAGIPPRNVAKIVGNILIRAKESGSQSLTLMASNWWQAGLAVYGEEVLANQ